MNRRENLLIRTGRNDRDIRRRPEIVRLVRGVHVEGRHWNAASSRERILLRATALQFLAGRRIVFSHSTAAAAWGLVWLGPLPMTLHATQADPLRAQTRQYLTLHAGPLEAGQMRTREGLTVTSPLVTVCDLLASMPPHAALALLDVALARGLVGTPDVAALLKRRGRSQGSRRAERVLKLGDGRNGSVGESWSRWLFDELRIPPPVLQKRFDDARGLIGYVDFWCPEFGVIGEFDGFGKYVRDEFTKGRTPAQVVVDEKRREDRLRALPGVRTVARWGWNDLTAEGLAAVLAGAGVRRRR